MLSLPFLFGLSGIVSPHQSLSVVGPVAIPVRSLWDCEASCCNGSALAIPIRSLWDCEEVGTSRLHSTIPMLPFLFGLSGIVNRWRGSGHALRGLLPFLFGLSGIVKRSGPRCSGRSLPFLFGFSGIVVEFSSWRIALPFLFGLSGIVSFDDISDAPLPFLHGLSGIVRLQPPSSMWALPFLHGLSGIVREDRHLHVLLAIPSWSLRDCEATPVSHAWVRWRCCHSFTVPQGL